MKAYRGSGGDVKASVVGGSKSPTAWTKLKTMGATGGPACGLRTFFDTFQRFTTLANVFSKPPAGSNIIVLVGTKLREFVGIVNNCVFY